MHESSKHFCFGCSLMPKLHRANGTIDTVSTTTVRSILCAIRPKIYCVKHRYLDFLLKIYLHIYFCKRSEIWDLTLKDLGFEEKRGFETWLNDINAFLERYEIWVKDFIWDLPITAHPTQNSWFWRRSSEPEPISYCVSVCGWGLCCVHGGWHAGFPVSWLQQIPGLSRTSQAFFEDPAVSQQCLNIQKNSSY